MNNCKSYTHIDDFDFDGADWMDVSCIGQVYELQVDFNELERWRHRFPAQFGPWIEDKPHGADK